MATCTAKMDINLNIAYALERDLATTLHQITLARGATFTNGTGANKANTVYDKTYTIADGGNEEFQLADGSLTDSHGTAVAFDIVRAIYIKNNSSDASLHIGAAAATQLGLFGSGTDYLILPPGGEFYYTAPNATGLDVTTNEDLKLTHDGTGSSTMDVDIIIVGEN